MVFFRRKGLPSLFHFAGCCPGQDDQSPPSFPKHPPEFTQVTTGTEAQPHREEAVPSLPLKDIIYCGSMKYQGTELLKPGQRTIARGLTLYTLR